MVVKNVYTLPVMDLSDCCAELAITRELMDWRTNEAISDVAARYVLERFAFACELGDRINQTSHDEPIEITEEDFFGALEEIRHMDDKLSTSGREQRAALHCWGVLRFYG